MGVTGNYRVKRRVRNRRDGPYRVHYVRYTTDACSLGPEDTLDTAFSGLNVSFHIKRCVAGFASFIRRIQRRGSEARSVLHEDIALRRADALRHANSKHRALRTLFSEPFASLVWSGSSDGPAPDQITRKTYREHVARAFRFFSARETTLNLSN
jgi:hypothetical protein